MKGKAGKKAGTCSQCLMKGKQGANQSRFCMSGSQESPRKRGPGLSFRMMTRVHEVKKGSKGTLGTSTVCSRDRKHKQAG